MFSSTGVRDCIQSNICSSSSTSPYAFSQYLQMPWQRGKVGILFVWPVRSLKKKVVTDFASHLYMYPTHSETDFSGYIWENSNSARVTMKKTPPFGNCGIPLTCAFRVAAVSVVTDIAATRTIQGTVPRGASLIFIFLCALVETPYFYFIFSLLLVTAYSVQ